MMNDSNSSAGNARKITWVEWLTANGLEGLFSVKTAAVHPFEDHIWQPGEQDRSAAWQLYTEMRTRIATQSLAYRSGDEATALDSIYRLFELSRSIIKQHDRCTHLATLSVFILNAHVRPFAAKWHRIKVDGRLSSADVRFDFRRELTSLQSVLRDFTRLLGLLAGDETLMEQAEYEAAERNQLSNLWDRLPFGIDTADTKYANAAKINEKERDEVSKRRATYLLSTSGEPTDAIGLSISGGGIRSATFALGVVQHLARRGILKQVDFLSTVSGGGYLGSFITSFLSDANDEIGLDCKADNLPFRAIGTPESQAVRHLRNHSKYLSEGGFKTIATVIGMVAYGVVVSMMLVAPWLLLSVLIAKQFWQEKFTGKAANFPGSVASSIVLVIAAAVLLVPIAQRLGRRTWAVWDKVCIYMACIATAVLLCGEIPFLFHMTTIDLPFLPLAFALIFSIFCGALGLWMGISKLLGRIVFGLFGVSGPLLALAGFLWLAYLFMIRWTDSTSWLIGITAGLFIYGGFILNINFASPHRFYRDRLARTYLIQHSANGEGVALRDPRPLSTMNGAHKAPYHLINAALNIPTCTDPNLRGRNTDFFLFSKHFCGSPIVGFQPTSEWEKMDEHLDLGTAMAISGAAAAPHMGTLTAPQFTFFLAMLNIRLGYWARNPGKPPLPILRNIEGLLPPVGWYYFLRELSGQMSEKTRYINLSDGGHIENLGIYELLRRRCKFIIAIDGEADPARSFGGLLTLTQLAKIDLGVRIEPDLADLRTDQEGCGRAHFGLSRLDYSDGCHGLLLYIKSSLTGNESEFLKKYRAEHPDFPHQSTANQLFGESQFEAYRSLGEHIAEDLFRQDLVDKWDNSLSTCEWFKRLAERLLA